MAEIRAFLVDSLLGKPCPGPHKRSFFFFFFCNRFVSSIQIFNMLASKGFSNFYDLEINQSQVSSIRLGTIVQKVTLVGCKNLTHQLWQLISFKQFVSKTKPHYFLLSPRQLNHLGIYLNKFSNFQAMKHFSKMPNRPKS